MLFLLFLSWSLTGQVLPETFFVPDGEPWELAPSTEGARPSARHEATSRGEITQKEMAQKIEMLPIKMLL
jgi:hypothetical protein